MNYLESIYQLIPAAWMDALGWTFLHSLWQGALISLLLAMVLLATRHHAPRKRYRYSYAALLLVLGAAITTFFLVFDPGVGSLAQTGNPAIAVTAEGFEWPAAGAATWSDYFDQHLPLIVVLWGAGVFLLSLRMLGGLIYLRRLTTHQVFPVPVDWQAQLIQLKKRSGLDLGIRLLASARVQSPLVIGVLKPVVLFPLGAINQLSLEEVEAVLAHELAHIRRHDFLLNLLQTLLETLFYFNPAVWWISNQIRTEREHGADDLAVAWCGDNMQYARALVRIQELNQRAPRLAMALGGQTRNQLLHRIQRIFNQTENNRTIMEKITVTLLLGTVLIFMGLSISNPQPAEAATPELTSSWITLDSVPKPKTLEIQEIISEDNGRKIELRTENGEVTRLVIDGKKIDPANYADYQKEIDGLMQNVPAPPAPPVPPTPPVPGVAPTPPTPPTPPKKEMKVEVHRTEKDGMVIMEVKVDEGEPMQIKVDGEREIILLDGDKLEDGDRKIIIRRDDQELIHEDDGTFFLRTAPEGEKQIIIEEIRGGDNPFFWKEEIALPEEPPQGVDKEEWERIREGLKQEMEIVRGLETEELRWIEEMKEKELHHSGLFPEERVIIEGRRGEGQPTIFFPGVRGGSAESKLEAELRHDGYYQDGKGYKFELTDRKLMINGKKQPEPIYQKYRNLYEESTGIQLARKSRVIIEK